MIKAMAAGIITESEGNAIWADMIRRRRMLPTATFSEYLKISRSKTIRKHTTRFSHEDVMTAIQKRIARFK